MEGCDFDRENKGYFKKLILKGNAIAKICHEFGETTNCPELYTTTNGDDNELAYCDCAGIDDDDGYKKTNIETTCRVINTQLALAKAKAIQGIVVVISESDFTVTRADGVKRLIKALSRIIKEPGKVADKIIFLYSRFKLGIKEGETLEQKYELAQGFFSQDINEIKKILNARLLDSQQNLEEVKKSYFQKKQLPNRLALITRYEAEVASYTKQIAIIELINRDNIFIADVTDGGYCRDKINAKLLSIESCETDAIDFTPYIDQYTMDLCGQSYPLAAFSEAGEQPSQAAMIANSSPILSSASLPEVTQAGNEAVNSNTKHRDKQ